MTRQSQPGPEAQQLAKLAGEVLLHLSVVLRNATLYEAHNDALKEPIRRLIAALTQVFSTSESFSLECTGSGVFANGARLRSELSTLHVHKYVGDYLQRLGIGGFRFDVALKNHDLEVLAQVARRNVTGVDAINQALEAGRATQVTALPLRELGILQRADRRSRAVAAYQNALDFIRETMSKLSSPTQFNVRRAKRLVHNLVDLSYESGDGFSLFGLASLKNHDAYTFNHMVNVCVLAIAFGQRLGFARRDLAQLGMCALYHDIGKLHIPLEVLNSHGPLTEKQWAVMGNHTVYAARTLFEMVGRDLGSAQRILTALMHHRQFDDQGYPSLRALSKQSIYTRITAIVDTFDAMTTKRVYQQRMLPDVALMKLLERAGTRYDPVLVKAFINCMGIFPAGSTVLLETGALAVVVEPSGDPKCLHQPTVRVVTAADKSLIDPYLVNLQSTSAEGLQIIRCIDPERFGINAAHFVL